MRVEWAALARFAEVQGGSLNIVGAGVDTLFVPTLPARIRIFAAIQLRLDLAEGPHPPPIEFVVRDQELRIVGEPITFPLGEVTPGPDHPPGWEIGLAVAFMLGFDAEAEGNHTLGILIGGEARWELPMRVRVDDV